MSTLGLLCLLVVAGGLVFLTADWVLILTASPLSLLFLVNEESVVSDAAERFTR